MRTRHGADRAAPPAVGPDERPRFGTILLGFLKPVPGRSVKMIRMTGIVLAVVTISETFQIPDPAISAYMAIVFFAADENATRKLAGLGGVVVSADVLAAIVQFMLDLSQPAFRLGVMALSTFAAGYLSRRSPLGPVAIIAALMIVSVQRNGDDVLSGALSAGSVSNTTSGALPELAFMSPEEALLHNVLWELLAFVYPIVLVFVVNRLTARPASEVLRAALVDRLETAAAACRGDPEADRRLVAAARSGLPALAAQNALAAKFERGRYDPSAGGRLIDGVARLLVVLVAWRHLPGAGPGTALPRPAAEACEVLARRLRTRGRDRGAVLSVRPAVPAADASAPLAAQLDAALGRIRSVLDGAPEAASAAPGGTAGAKPDPGPVRFALKLTLAVMSAYLFMALTDWSQISTCLTTCFVLATDSLGQTFHKMLLRVAGALAGGAVGFLAVLVAMPLLTDIGDLLLLLAPVLLAFTWIRVGSERVAYFGQQAAFAFLLTVVQDFGPTLEFQAARNRIVGILVGEAAMFLVFSRLWPETVGDVVRRSLADALGALGKLIGPRATEDEADTYRRFDAAIAKVRSVLPDDPYETPVRGRGAGGTIDARTLERIQALVVPVSILADLDRVSTVPAGEAARAAALAAWLDACATWVRTGRGAQALVSALPGRPAAAEGARTFWLDLLERDLRGLLDDVGPAALVPGSAQR